MSNLLRPECNNRAVSDGLVESFWMHHVDGSQPETFKQLSAELSRLMMFRIIESVKKQHCTWSQHRNKTDRRERTDSTSPLSSQSFGNYYEHFDCESRQCPFDAQKLMFKKNRVQWEYFRACWTHGDPCQHGRFKGYNQIRNLEESDCLMKHTVNRNRFNCCTSFLSQMHVTLHGHCTLKPYKHLPDHMVSTLQAETTHKGMISWAWSDFACEHPWKAAAHLLQRNRFLNFDPFEGKILLIQARTEPPRLCSHLVTLQRTTPLQDLPKIIAEQGTKCSDIDLRITTFSDSANIKVIIE